MYEIFGKPTKVFHYQLRFVKPMFSFHFETSSGLQLSYIIDNGVSTTIDGDR